MGKICDYIFLDYSVALAISQIIAASKDRAANNEL
jgi:hypothetical protein